MRLYSWNIVLFSLLSACLALNSREISKPVEGLHENTPRVHALVGAKVVTAPGRSIDNGIVIVRDGLIEAVGSGIKIPSDARVWDLSGKTIYPGFIDAYSNIGMPEGLKPFVRITPGDSDGPPPKKPPTPGISGASHWNPLITPERKAEDYLNPKEKEIGKLNEIGFTTAASFPGRGILRGKGVLIHLNDDGVQESIIDADIGQHISFEFSSRGEQNPTSLMGSIALVRQALYDAQWYDASHKVYTANADKVEHPEYNAALEALGSVAMGNQIALFHARNELDYQRIQSIGEEFNLQYALLGNGYEYRRATIIKEMGSTVILPLAFPEIPPVERMDRALDISLEHLEHWELAPSNAAFLEKSGVPFCLTAHHLKDPSKEFWPALRQAVKRGLSKDKALAALTSEPAELYSMEDQLGSIEKGKIGSLIVATGNLFTEDKTKVAMVWINGDPVEQKPWSMGGIEGRWSFAWNGIDGFSEGEFKTNGNKVSLQVDDTKYSGSIHEEEILLFVDSAAFGKGEDKTVARLRANRSMNVLEGTGVLPGIDSFSWRAELIAMSDPEEKESEDSESDSSVPELVFEKYPAGAFGVGKRTDYKEILVKNATVWTSGPMGILPKGDVLVRNGKISRIGHNLKASKNALVIDATGKHVTPGIIDCHSHLAISEGVNEGSIAVSCEVRIEDVLNPLDMNIYRQLAGGVTVSNSLHGSANPMGGQNQLIRMRWGRDADGIKFKEAKPSIKFALGENVKQSNWGPDNTTRYPQTRMGVTEIMESNFRAAEDYERRWKEYKSGKSILPPRKDLRMDAILKTLKGDLAIHIHAYRQDEILVFSRLAKELNLHVAAFQHVLEGYKVAEAMTDIGAGGSSFSDWWAYKFEVYDAIPHNGALMHDAGVLVSFNSDDAELATRLNTEAAKAVKYGGVSEEEALKFVTINSAIQLGVEDLVGSLEKGKDADFVIWSAHPLSTFAHAEQTWIEGVKYFDREENKTLAQRDELERERLIQNALKAQLKEESK